MDDLRIASWCEIVLITVVHLICCNPDLEHFPFHVIAKIRNIASKGNAENKVHSLLKCWTIVTDYNMHTNTHTHTHTIMHKFREAMFYYCSSTIHNFASSYSETGCLFLIPIFFHFCLLIFHPSSLLHIFTLILSPQDCRTCGV